jgi:hypothetical protein
MKKMIFLLIMLLPALAYGEPSINFETEQHDFGQAKQGEQLEFAFQFSNQGADDLSIKRITAS